MSVGGPLVEIITYIYHSFIEMADQYNFMALKIGFEKLFRDWVCQVLLKMFKKYTRFYRFLLIPPSQLKVLNFEAFG